MIEHLREWWVQWAILLGGDFVCPLCGKAYHIDLGI